MPVLTAGRKQIVVDGDGCLVNFNDWNEDVARKLAELSGTGELTAESLAMLKFIRDHYRAYNFFPIVNSICKKLHEPKDCVAEKFYNPLVAWKLAGLPHPEEPVVSLLEAGQSPG
jgi:TusE/DsrC/DsvC family sulfur relay protein